MILGSDIGRRALDELCVRAEQVIADPYDIWGRQAIVGAGIARARTEVPRSSAEDLFERAGAAMCAVRSLHHGQVAAPS